MCSIPAVGERNHHRPANHANPEAPPKIFLFRMPFHFGDFMELLRHKPVYHKNDRENQNREKSNTSILLFQ